MTVEIIVSDCTDALREMEAESVDCVVTSPPYWGLRDYGTASWEGGVPECDHQPPHEGGTSGNRGNVQTHAGRFAGTHCYRCGAKRIDKQLGLEPTLAEHLSAMVAVFEEVKRVLKPDGTCWVNYGDCYATSINGRSAAVTKALGTDDRTFRDKPFSTVQGVMKPKDLCMVPNRFAIAMQEAGWWVRSEIIWAKPNPMPESIKDRPATSHEKIWLFTKAPRYFYDADAVRQVRTQEEDANGFRGGSYVGGIPGKRSRVGNVRAGKIRGSSVATPRHIGQISHTKLDATPRGEGRNLRNYEPAPAEVWPIATMPFSEAHFATFPPELAKRCIEAGCPVGGTVLDPFGGAGTTGLVADRLQRNAVLIELNPEYAQIARKRLAADRPAMLELMEGAL